MVKSCKVVIKIVGVIMFLLGSSHVELHYVFREDNNFMILCEECPTRYMY